jgi:trehalose-phosphatase
MSIPSPLLGALDAVESAVEAASRLALFLDFDGTLAPIAESPGLARLPSGTRETLQALAGRDGWTVGIVSGRSLDDVRRRVGIDGLIYAGNHGLEIAGGGLHFDEPRALALKADVGGAVGVLVPLLGHIDGALVEPKGQTASVHYRRVRAEDRDEVERVVRRAVPEDHPDLVVVAGKMVWEVRPRVVWNKGTAIGWIRDRLGLAQALTFYLGDDRTDEDAFARIGPFVTARVGPPQPTRAGYRIADTDEVAEFLSWLARPGRSGAVRD